MNFSFSRRKLAFLASFAVIPATLWAAAVRPTLAERSACKERQDKAHVVQARNRQLPAQRDQLAAQWREFLPTARAALDNLSNDLNPHLVQKRIFDTAQEQGCRVKISRMASKDDAHFARFSLTGEGSYSGLVKLIDQLEQGQHYVRFERLNLELPKADRESAESKLVRVSGVLLIPRLELAAAEGGAQ
jgi:hypothetical protein